MGEEIREPNFSDEAGGAYEQDIFSAERGADGKGLVAGARFVVDYWDVHLGRGAFGWFDSFVEDLWIFFEAQDADQFFAGDAAVGLAAGEACEGASGTDYGIEQASGGHPFAKIEAIGDDARDAQVLG